MMEKGKLYGVGVGPGDPELLTVKAVRILRECDVVAAPGGERTAYSIAECYVQGKETLFCDLPMTRDKRAMAESHEKAAHAVCGLLDAGKTVAFLTLGDPSVYSTYWYVHKRVRARGYDAEMIPGVPSFCAAAAALDRALCEGSEPLHILPASHRASAGELELPGSLVLMKAGRSILEVRDRLQSAGRLEGAALVERCGMEGERIVTDLTALSDPTGYFSIILARDASKEEDV